MRSSHSIDSVVRATVLVICFTLCGSAFGAPSARYLSRGDFRLAYRVFGQGEPLFLLNGGPGRSSDTFIPLAERLVTETHRQVILFDQRGTGLSRVTNPGPANMTLDLMVEDLEALRVHLGFGKIGLFGHSFGGMYAMAYSARFPSHVSALLLSCSGGVDGSWHEYASHNMISRLSPKARRRLAYWESDEAQKKDPARAGREITRILAPTYVYHPEFAAQITHDLLHYNAPGINPLIWLSMKNYDLRKAFKNFVAPTLVIDGRQDILGEQVPISIQAAIPGSRLELIDECAHYPWLDQPKKYFGFVREFFASVKSAFRLTPGIPPRSIVWSARPMGDRFSVRSSQ